MKARTDVKAGNAPAGGRASGGGGNGRRPGG
jgi:hypothetical protein